MNTDQQRALLTLALYAGFADGHKADSEREAIRRMAESLSDAQGGHPLASLYQDVLLRRVSVADAVRHLGDPAHAQLAYEMAVCVCDADGSQSAEEKRFLADLRGQLGLQPAAVQAFEAQADAIAAYAGAAAVPTASAASAAMASAPVSAPPAPAQDAALDQSILNHAILNGALELLPQSWASMAIVPLQVKMVYAIGKAHGVELDQGHIKEFIAAAGIGLTSQYIEQFGRKLLGGLLGKLGGGLLRGIGNQAVSSGMSFAATYALGQVARRYYAGGRTLSAQTLKDTYASVTREAQGLQGRYLPAMQEQARTLDAGKVLAMVRGT